jgi:uncharacterized glyoxalase superfamily protein PhnB
MTENSPAGMPRIVPYPFYEDVAGAIDWLAKAFGFVEHLRYTEDDGSVSHAEVRFLDGVLMLGGPGGGYQNPKHNGNVHATLVVYVDDVDDHCARAKAAGAEVIDEPADKPYGDRMYSVLDPEGHRWDFCQHVRDVNPEDWGATVTEPG